MNDIQITVADLKYAEGAQKKGRVKDTSGKYWYVWNDKMPDFSVGKTYMVLEFDTYEGQRGPMHTIKRYQQVVNNQQSAPKKPVSAISIGTDDQQRRMDIFICGGFNNIMSNPNTQASECTMMEMIDTLHKLKSAWMAVFGPSPLPRPRAGEIQQQSPPSPPNHGDDMDDEIPF